MHPHARATCIGLTLSLALLACTRTRTVVVTDSDAAEKAGESGWRALGKRTVHGRHDHDSIQIGGSEGKFTKLRIEVKGSALEMYNIVVVFASGDKFSPDTRIVFGKGEESRVIDLPGGERTIREVRFHYGNLPRGGKAQVKLFGS